MRTNIACSKICTLAMTCPKTHRATHMQCNNIQDAGQLVELSMVLRLSLSLSFLRLDFEVLSHQSKAKCGGEINSQAISTSFSFPLLSISTESALGPHRRTSPTWIFI